MKRGDVQPVMLGVYHVADAVIVDFDGEDKVVLEIPATRIVMGKHSSLGDLPIDPNAKDRQIIGVEDPARAELEAAGVELDDDDDFMPTPTAPAEGASLKEMKLDGLD